MSLTVDKLRNIIRVGGGVSTAALVAEVAVRNGDSLPVAIVATVVSVAAVEGSYYLAERPLSEMIGGRGKKIVNK